MLNVDKGVFGRHSIAEECFRVMEALLPENKVLLELGSGRATNIFARLWKVYSVEHDPKWLNRAKGSMYIHAPLVDNWYDAKTLKSHLPKKYDMLLVDGPPGEYRKYLNEHLSLFKKGVIWIVDDSYREKNLIKNIEKYLGRPGEYHPEAGKEKAFTVFK